MHPFAEVQAEGAIQCKSQHAPGGICTNILVPKAHLERFETTHPQDNYAISTRSMLGFTGQSQGAMCGQPSWTACSQFRFIRTGSSMLASLFDGYERDIT